MSKNSVEIILAKLQRLDEYISYLKELAAFPQRTFINDHHIYGLAERYLHLCIEILLDVGKLFIIERGLPRPENSHEIFELLARHKVISQALFKRIRGMAGFRNILVHDYMKVDRAIVYRQTKSGLKDLVALRKAFLRKLG